MVPHLKIAIAGTGFAGLGAAIRLKQAGVGDFALFERAGEVGGVWRDNSYPGCACDVESHLYSFSFAPNPEWTRSYAPQEEIRRYLVDCAERYGIVPHIRFHHELTEARWDDRALRWHIETSRGPFTADVLVAGVGALSDPAIPTLPGIERFEGRAFHSARWDHSYELGGKRVAVVGTGASAIQFVPQIQPKVAQLTLFQRTPPWVMPRGDRAIPERTRQLLRRSRVACLAMRAQIYARRELFVLLMMHPEYGWVAEKLARKHLATQIRDPELRRKLTPEYTIGCKRILLSDDYLPSLEQPNVEVVTDAIREVRANSIVAADGVERPVDAIIYGTGFQVTDLPISHRVRGRDGRTLAEQWQGSPKAHLGTTVHGFPNLFLLQGPNTGLGHTSVIIMIESQVEHMMRALGWMRGRNVQAIEPRAEAQAAFVAEVDDKMRGSVWTTGGCKSWYLDGTGRNSTLWPGYTFSFRRRVEKFAPADYRALQAADDATAAPSTYVRNQSSSTIRLHSRSA